MQFIAAIQGRGEFKTSPQKTINLLTPYIQNQSSTELAPRTRIVRNVQGVCSMYNKEARVLTSPHLADLRRCFEM